MKKILFGSIALAAVAAATASIAQPAPPAPPAPVVTPAPHAMPVRVMQPQTRNAVVEKVRTHFAQLDTNRDGYLTKAEAEAGRAAKKTKWAGRRGQGERPAMDRGAIFDRLDTNHDGMISREEFAKAPTRQERRVVIQTDRDGDGQPDQRMLGKRHGGGMGMARLGGRMFEQADVNRDSRVSLKEATDAALKHFDMADANRDGTLTPEERQQMRTRMKEMHRVTRAS